MVRYTKPCLEILYYDEDEIVMASTAQTAQAQINERFYNDNNAGLTTSINIKDVQITVE